MSPTIKFETSKVSGNVGGIKENQNGVADALNNAITTLTTFYLFTIKTIKSISCQVVRTSFIVGLWLGQFC